MRIQMKNRNWRKNFVLQKCLTLVTMIACISSTKSAAVPPKNNSDICCSAQCIQSASEVLSKMKPEIQPCDDFYEFACGKFTEEVAIPEDKEQVSAFTMLEDIVAEQIKDIIVEERPPTDPKHLRLPNLFYKACMNTTLIEKLGASPITNISDAVGGWPLIIGDAWNSDDKWSWQTTLKKLSKFGLPQEGIFSTTVVADDRNNTKAVLYLAQPTLDINVKLLRKGFNESLVTAFYEYMVDIAVFLGADAEKAKSELKEVLEFEMNLANISVPIDEEWDPNDFYNLFTIKQLQNMYPYVQWLDHINGLLPEGLLVDENETIDVSVPSFFEALGPLLEKTPKRVIANYMIWQSYNYAVTFLSEKFRERHLRYQTAAAGITKMKPRWEECVDFVKESLDISVGSLYVQHYFKGNSKAITQEMVNNIWSAFDDLLGEVTWMDDITKQEAKTKLRSMNTFIGYPDELLDNNKLEPYYRSLEIDPEKYFQSILKVNAFSIENYFNKLRLPVSLSDWEFHSIPTVTKAIYVDTENSLVLPACILQGQFFNAERSKYINYGTIGFIIGHETTHGFDNQGHEFGKDGNLTDWWQSGTKQAFDDKVTCIKEQYNNYTDEENGLSVNGVITQSENIADNGGVKAAYRAYRKWAATNGPELKLPGLDFTPEQLFWISAAQAFCTNIRKEAQKLDITTGFHSPAKFRVLGSLSNMKEFSKDFQCPEGSLMNPAKKCEIW